MQPFQKSAPLNGTPLAIPQALSTFIPSMRTGLLENSASHSSEPGACAKQGDIIKSDNLW